MQIKKVSCSVVGFGDQVYVFGGKSDRESYLDQVEIYRDELWQLCSVKLKVPSYNLGAFAVSEHMLLLCGGIQQTGGISNKAYIFQLTEETLQELKMDKIDFYPNQGSMVVQDKVGENEFLNLLVLKGAREHQIFDLETMQFK